MNCSEISRGSSFPNANRRPKEYAWNMRRACFVQMVISRPPRLLVRQAWFGDSYNIHKKYSSANTWEFAKQKLFFKLGDLIFT